MSRSSVFADLPVIDPTIMEGLVELGGDDGGAFVGELVESYVSIAPGIVANLEATLGMLHGGPATPHPELRRLEQLAHKLRGMSMNLGAARVSACARKLEETCRAGSSIGVADWIREIAAAFQEAAEHLRTRWQPGGRLTAEPVQRK